MSSNRKPRKAYRPMRWLSPATNRQLEDHIHGVLQSSQIAIGIKLPQGIAELEDLRCLRDILNIAEIVCMNREFYTDESRCDCIDLIEKAFEAWRAIWLRGYDALHFVARGDELKVIRQAMDFFADIADTSLKECPKLFIKELAALTYLSRGAGPNNDAKPTPFSRAEIKEAVRKAYRYEVVGEIFKRGLA